MLKTIHVNDLVIGMYVTRIVRKQKNVRLSSGGLVRSQHDLDYITQKGVIEVEIDLARSVHIQEEKSEPEPSEESQNYTEQLNRCMEFYENAKKAHSSIFERIATNKHIDISEVKEMSSRIVDHVFENIDTVGALTQMRQADHYLLEHSVNCVILITLLGNELNLDQQELYECGTGAMLMDLGMARLPLLLTHKNGLLNEKERNRIQHHVDWAEQAVQEHDDISPISLSVISEHHERIDGSGYPAGLRGEQISVFGRMAAIVDTYDALVSDRPWRDAKSPSAALQHMQDKESTRLDMDILDAFIRCIGAYPMGSMVRLSNGILAVVAKPNLAFPMKPLLMGVYDLNNRTNIAPRLIRLSKEKLTIEDSLPADDFAKNISEFLRQAFALD